MMSKGGGAMNYIKIVEQIATDNNTTPEEVDMEIRNALDAAQISVEPDLFISMVASKLSKNLSIG